MTLARPITFVLGLLLFLSLPAVAQQAQTLFSHPVVSKDAERYESYLKSTFKPGKQTARQQREAGLKVLTDGGDARVAARHLATAVVTDAKDTAAWTGLAKALLAMTPDPARPAERYWCRVCNRHGLLKNLGHEERASSRQLGRDTHRQHISIQPHAEPKPEHVPFYRQLYAEVALWAHTWLLDPCHPEPRAYLHGRGLDDAMVSRAVLGVTLSDPDSLVEHLRRACYPERNGVRGRYRHRVASKLRSSPRPIPMPIPTPMRPTTRPAEVVRQRQR